MNIPHTYVVLKMNAHVEDLLKILDSSAIVVRRAYNTSWSCIASMHVANPRHTKSIECPPPLDGSTDV